MSKKTETGNEYEVFISGELIDLVIPNEYAIYQDGWHKWFNDQRTSRYLYQGIFPNTVQDQEEFLNDIRKNKKRIALLIKPKDEDYIVGIASLSKVDYVQRQAEFAMVIGKQSKTIKSKMYGMEAKCLMTEHAFNTVGIERINSAQCIELKEWQRWQILIGYKMEGVSREAFRKGIKIYDVINSSCLLSDYMNIIDKRSGRLWPGYSKMMDLIRALPKKSLEEEMSQAIKKIVDNYSKNIKFT